MTVLRLLMFAGLVIGPWAGVSAQTPRIADLEPVRALASSLTDEDGEAAEDISGIACMPLDGARRRCLVINDEDRSAQFATLEAGRLTGGRRLGLIGKKSSDATVGPEPKQNSCSEGKAKFKDLDGEGVAYERPYFYVAGSHGCSRKSNKFRSSTFILARVRVDGEGNIVAAHGTVVDPAKSQEDHVETSYRLGHVLRAAPRVGPFFAHDLSEADGLNIEGIAVAGGRLFAGLRAPVIDDHAFLVSAGVSRLFARDLSPATFDIGVIPLRLGKNAGVRDLTSLGNGRLLVLSGPTQEQKQVPYGLFLVDLASPNNPTFLATLSPVVQEGIRGKAEAVVVLSADADALRVLVMFDSLPNGGPREYRVPLR